MTLTSVTKRFAICAILAATSLLVAAPTFAASCESLSNLKLTNTKIDAAQMVPAGAFTPPGANANAAAAYKNMPAFCRVSATLTPSSDSDIKIEVWLPESDWNNKLQSVGNGGWAGVISYRALADAVSQGYASASTDTGHSSDGGSFALGHPEKMTDFAYRAVHEMTVAAKAIITAFYGRAAQIAYWNGCSTGGRQGLGEAQRYPADYDGIIAGASANNRIHAFTQSVSVAQVVHKDEASNIPPAKFAMIHKAVLDACDAIDGLKDGLISDPRLCRFDPNVLLCQGADGPSCLTAAQVNSVRAMYTASKNPRTGKEIYPGLLPGSELGWNPTPLAYATDGFKYVTFKNPDWDYHTLNLDTDVALAEKIDDGATSEMDPHLTDFFGHGGKLLMYHGWADPNISPLNSINYYQSVLKTMGPSAENSIRLFMFPGMGHCRGGEGPDTFDAMGTLSQWVEHGQAPNQVLASHAVKGVVDRTRPICAYPQVATYKGTGSIDDAENFVCKAP